MLDLIGLIIVNESSLQRKIDMQERHLCWAPYFFLWPGSAPQFFHSRIATDHGFSLLTSVEFACVKSIILYLSVLHSVRCLVCIAFEIGVFMNQSEKFPCQSNLK